MQNKNSALQFTSSMSVYTQKEVALKAAGFFMLFTLQAYTQNH